MRAATCAFLSLPPFLPSEFLSQVALHFSDAPPPGAEKPAEAAASVSSCIGSSSATTRRRRRVASTVSAGTQTPCGEKTERASVASATEERSARVSCEETSQPTEEASASSTSGLLVFSCKGCSRRRVRGKDALPFPFHCRSFGQVAFAIHTVQTHWRRALIRQKWRVGWVGVKKEGLSNFFHKL